MTLEETTYWLKRTFSVPNVKVECGKIKTFGKVALYKGTFFILINDCICCKIDTLLHEFAHILTWNTGEYSDEWGIAYAQLRRAYDMQTFGRRMIPLPEEMIS